MFITCNWKWLDVLNHLKNEINAQFGYEGQVPRINLGPCGRFAKIFYGKWNGRFDRKVIIAFLMQTGKEYCHHILIKLPDGHYYDGGYGVSTKERLITAISESYLDDMMTFQDDLLERRSFGLTRDYPRCPSYSDNTVIQLIDAHLHLIDNVN